jgi:hypothetical protein
MFTYARRSQPGRGIKETATYRTSCQPREMTSKERFHIADCLSRLLPQDPFTFSIFVAVNVAEVAERSFGLEKLRVTHFAMLASDVERSCSVKTPP